MPLTIEDVHKRISSNIIRLRREKSLTQEELANQIECSQAFIQKLESSGKHCNIEQIYRIATALECSIHTILPEIKIELESENER